MFKLYLYNVDVVYPDLNAVNVVTKTYKSQVITLLIDLQILTNYIEISNLFTNLSIKKIDYESVYKSSIILGMKETTIEENYHLIEDTGFSRDPQSYFRITNGTVLSLSWIRHLHTIVSFKIRKTSKFI